MVQFDLSPISKFLVLRPRDKPVQQTGVGALGVLSLTAFVTEVLKKVLNERLHGS